MKVKTIDCGSAGSLAERACELPNERDACGRFTIGNRISVAGGKAKLGTRDKLVALRAKLVDLFSNPESDFEVHKMIRRVYADKPEKCLEVMMKLFPTELLIDAKVEKKAPIVIPDILKSQSENSN